MIGLISAICFVSHTLQTGILAVIGNDSCYVVVRCSEVAST